MQITSKQVIEKIEKLFNRNLRSYLQNYEIWECNEFSNDFTVSDRLSLFMDKYHQIVEFYHIYRTYVEYSIEDILKYFCKKDRDSFKKIGEEGLFSYFDELYKNLSKPNAYFDDLNIFIERYANLIDLNLVSFLIFIDKILIWYLKSKLYDDLRIDEIKITSYLQYKEIIEEYKENNEIKEMWYRGQTDSSWKLLPSFYRNTKRTITKTVDIKYIEEKYEKYNLINKYNNVYDYSKINYTFLTIMQHSVAFSPLLDFTLSYHIALMFALSNYTQDYNHYYNCDASVYFIGIRNPELNKVSENGDLIDNIIDNFQCTIAHKSPFLFGEKIVPDYRFGIDPIQYANSYHIPLQTNDRMKYQKGKFVLFSNFILLFNEIPVGKLHDKNDGIIMRKIIIPRENKDSILKDLLAEYPWFELNHLMNPYMYFGSPFNK